MDMKWCSELLTVSERACGLQSGMSIRKIWEYLLKNWRDFATPAHKLREVNWLKRLDVLLVMSAKVCKIFTTFWIWNTIYCEKNCKHSSYMLSIYNSIRWYRFSMIEFFHLSCYLMHHVWYSRSMCLPNFSKQIRESWTYLNFLDIFAYLGMRWINRCCGTADQVGICRDG